MGAFDDFISHVVNDSVNGGSGEPRPVPGSIAWLQERVAKLEAENRRLKWERSSVSASPITEGDVDAARQALDQPRS